MQAHGKVKQQRAVLERTIARAVAIVTEFVPARIKPLEQNEHVDDSSSAQADARPRSTEQFWNARSLRVGDWDALTRQVTLLEYD